MFPSLENPVFINLSNGHHNRGVLGRSQKQTSKISCKRAQFLEM